ncbi:hypothetical protein GUJ93_ZPchr0010g7697 [Zizania palustris]|uniref:Uncharacterized protein n=1 Tax=Zizania palustris TaxID=103762 RepID=A0A8J6BHT0_ZIZPA|nr:hypothetical protein GUJ93_ZPchr0010g7697 [Zizania palustris]
MEVEMMEDDVFFAELTKRIALLITDDDEADFASAAAPVPAFSLLAHAHVPMGGASMLAPPAYTLYHHAASYNGAGARAWQQQQQQQRDSKGTGVFIPRSSPVSAHYKKKGRSKSKGGATQKAAGALPLPAKKQSSHK